MDDGLVIRPRRPLGHGRSSFVGIWINVTSGVIFRSCQKQLQRQLVRLHCIRLTAHCIYDCDLLILLQTSTGKTKRQLVHNCLSVIGETGFVRQNATRKAIASRKKSPPVAIGEAILLDDPVETIKNTNDLKKTQWVQNRLSYRNGEMKRSATRVQLLRTRPNHITCASGATCRPLAAGPER